MSLSCLVNHPGPARPARPARAAWPTQSTALSACPPARAVMIWPITVKGAHQLPTGCAPSPSARRPLRAKTARRSLRKRDCCGLWRQFVPGLPAGSLCVAAVRLGCRQHRRWQGAQGGGRRGHDRVLSGSAGCVSRGKRRYLWRFVREGLLRRVQFACRPFGLPARAGLRPLANVRVRSTTVVCCGWHRR